MFIFIHFYLLYLRDESKQRYGEDVTRARFSPVHVQMCKPTICPVKAVNLIFSLLSSEATKAARMRLNPIFLGCANLNPAGETCEFCFFFLNMHKRGRNSASTCAATTV